MNSSTQKSVLITGASSGIGKATALQLDKQGWRVYAGVRTEEAADELEAEASENLFPVFLDITDPASVRAARKDLEADLKDQGGLNGLVNNAGVVIAGPIEALPIGKLKHQFNVNLFGQVAVTQAFLPLLREGTLATSHSRIINISSIAGRSSYPYIGAYAASKHAFEAVSDALRFELRTSDIDVVIVEPGVVETPLWDRAKKAAEEILDRVPPERMRCYRDDMDAMARRTEKVKRQGIPQEKVASVIVRALTNGHPKTRYLVGPDATIIALASNLLPDRVRDWLIDLRLKSF